MITSAGTTEIKIVKPAEISFISDDNSPLAPLIMVMRIIPAAKIRLKNQQTFRNLVNTSFKTILLSYILLLTNFRDFLDLLVSISQIIHMAMHWLIGMAVNTKSH